MATYYINESTGSDSNDGSSGSPWKYLPWDRRASSNSLTHRNSNPSNNTYLLPGGTTSLYAGPDYDTSTSNIGAWEITSNSGSISNLIIDTTNGQPFVIDMNLKSPNGVTVLAGATGRVVTNVTIRNITVRHTKQYDSANDQNTAFQVLAGAGAGPNPGPRGTVFEDCIAEDNQGHGFTVFYFSGSTTAVPTSFSEGTIFRRCIARRNSGVGVAGVGGSDVRTHGFGTVRAPYTQFLDCESYSNGKESYVAGPPIELDARGIYLQSNYSIIRGCRIYDNGLKTAGTGEGTGIEASAADNVIIERNNLIGSVTPFECKNSCDNWVVQGNVCSGSSAYTFQFGFFSSHSSNIDIRNNTIIAEADSPLQYVIEITSPTISFRNNLVIAYAYAQTAMIVCYGSTLTSTILGNAGDLFANNCWISAGGAVRFARLASTASNYTQYATLADAVTAFPSLFGTSVTSDPLVDRAYRPKASSPLIAAGSFQKSYPGADGRTMRNPPTIGAYEYVRPRSTRT